MYEGGGGGRGGGGGEEVNLSEPHIVSGCTGIDYYHRIGQEDQMCPCNQEINRIPITAKTTILPEYIHVCRRRRRRGRRRRGGMYNQSSQHR